MPPVQPSRFAGLLRSLSADSFARFVADLWAAQGWETTAVEGGVIAVDGDRRRRLRVQHAAGRIGRRSPPAAAAEEWDVLVTSARDPPATELAVLTADDLRERALYAVDRGDCEALFARHLDHPVTVDRASAGAGADGDGAGRVGDAALAATPVPLPTRRASLAVALALAVVLAGGLVGGPGRMAAALSAATTPADDELVAGDEAELLGTPVAETGGDGDATGAGTGARNAADGTYPPGLGPGGVTDAARLAAAHHRALADRPHRWTMEVTFVHAGNTSWAGYHHERATVAGDGRYRLEVGAMGGVLAHPALLGFADVYADGTTAFARTERDPDSFRPVDPANATVTRRPVGAGPVPFDERTGRLLRVFLTVVDSDVADSTERNGTVRYTVTASGDPFPGTTESSTSAVVDEDGVVRELQRVHRVTGTDIVVTVRFRLTVLERPVDLERPEWVPGSGDGNATATPTGGDERTNGSEMTTGDPLVARTGFRRRGSRAGRTLEN